MNKLTLLCVYLTFFLTSLIKAERDSFSLASWKHQCFQFPEHTHYYPNNTIKHAEFKNSITKNISLMQSDLSNSTWLNNIKPSTLEAKTFTPFVQKLIVPAKSTAIFFGDLHGNIHSMLRSLMELKKKRIINDALEIIPQDYYIIFLGDYVDRGFYGVEVLYTLAELKLKNPDRVFMVRGNHEDPLLNTFYGFDQEVRTKFPDNHKKILKKIAQFYETMPLALYVCSGTKHNMNALLCCHGGLEIGFNAKELLQTKQDVQFQFITEIKREKAIRTLPSRLKQDIITIMPEKELQDFQPTLPTVPCTNGFMWSDFIDTSTTQVVDYSQERGWKYGKELTSRLLKEQSSSFITLRGIIRAHQHYGSMLKKLKENNGLFALWDKTVYTLLSIPMENIGHHHDSFTILTTADQYKDWHIENVLTT